MMTITTMTADNNSNNKYDYDDDDEAVYDKVKLYQRIVQEAEDTLREEPEMCHLLRQTVLAPGVTSFDRAVASTICYRLLQKPQAAAPCQQTTGSNGSNRPTFCPNQMLAILQQAFENEEEEFKEGGHCMSSAVCRDAMAVVERDPACETLLEVILFYKGFAALVCHRAARQKWLQLKRRNGGGRRSMTALFLQSQASAVFGVDLHPACIIGAGVLLDHGTGIVVGETAVIGDGCTLLHGVTLGGTGKDSGDRHPKVGSWTLIGAGAKVLGNIRIGNGCKIGAGSVVLRPIPDGATAVGAPAKIIGRAQERRPSLVMDDTLQHVSFLHKSHSITTMTTSNKITTGMASTEGFEKEEENEQAFIENKKQGGETQEDAQVGIVLAIGDNKPEDAESMKEVKFPEVTTQGQLLEETKLLRLEEPALVGPGTSTINVLHSDKNSRISCRSKKNKNFGFLQHQESNDDQVPLESAMCPFRAYRNIRAPPGAWTFQQFVTWLKPLGCSEEDIGSLFFALDTRNVGYVYGQDFLSALTPAPSNKDSETLSTTAAPTVTVELLQQYLPCLSVEQIQDIFEEAQRQERTSPTSAAVRVQT